MSVTEELTCDHIDEDDEAERCSAKPTKWVVVHGVAGADFTFCQEHFDWFAEPDESGDSLADYHGDLKDD